MNQDLMLAVLAMDAYNTKGSVGTAVNLKIVISPEMLAAGFSAQAYTYNGETIISYRGTDGAYIGDVLNGWGAGAGYAPTQASLAAEFYRAVIGANASPYSGNVTFTGHSLGGGLAGLMAGLYSQDAVTFDNMAYGGAINDVYGNAIRPYNIDLQTGLVIPGEENPFHQLALDDFYPNVQPQSPDTSGISGWQMQGQVLQGWQSTGTAVGGTIDWGLGALDLHKQALLVLAMYELNENFSNEWHSVSKFIGRAILGADETAIAYSVVDEGTMPSGNVAAKAMFDDANDLGRLFIPESKSIANTITVYDVAGEVSFQSSLAEIVVAAAESAAAHQEMANDVSVRGAAITTESNQFAINLKGGITDNLVTSVENYLVQTLSPANEEADQILQDVDVAVFSQGGSTNVDSILEQFTEGYHFDDRAQVGTLVVGSTEIDTIKGGKGDDFLIGGGGADTLIGGDGKDALFGGEGADILVSGNLDGVNSAAEASGIETVSGGAGTDYIVLSMSPVGLSEAPPPDIIIEGGDKADRLLIHRHLIDSSAFNGEGKQPLFALLGAVIGGNTEEHGELDVATLNVGENENGEVYRAYSYNGQEAVFSSSFGLENEITEFNIVYYYYAANNRLEIEFALASDTRISKIVINDFEPGDYGIKLSGPFALFNYNHGGNDNGPTYDPLQGISPYNAEIRAIRDKADDYVLEEDGSLALNRSTLSMQSNSTPDSTVHMALRGDMAANVLSGNDVAERLYGEAGDDTISASGGDDRLFGGDGTDRLIGGQGADQLDGGAGVDTADYRTSTAAVQVNLLAQSGVGGDAEGDTLVFIENLAGSQFGDVLTGDAGVNRLQGFEGDDQLLGGGGNDRLLGGLGADVINGGDGVDTADYANSLAAVTVNLKLNLGQGADAAGDTFIAIENLSGSDFNDTLVGDDLANRLSGVDGNDTLSGLGGIDYLVGGSGNDVMTGGAGADVFVFNLGSGLDTITDFWAGTGRTDRIQFLDGQLGTFAGVIAQAANTAAGVVITLSANDSLTLSGVQISQLQADDFLFA